MSERMQALLSRAVEDQLTEQRQLASLVAEVRALLAALPAEVTAAAQGDEVWRAEVTALRAGLTAVEQRLEVLTALAQRPSDHSEVTGAVGTVGQRVGALEQRLNSLETRLAEVGATLNTQSSAAAEAEQRITRHVDEAVLALAEVLVRKSRPAASSPARPVVASEPEIAPAETSLPAAEDPTPPDVAIDIDVVPAEPAAEPVQVEAASVEPPADDLDDEIDDDLDAELDDDLDEDDDLDDLDDEQESAPAAASTEPLAEHDPWAVRSPFQPGPARERQETGAAAALAELQAGESAAADEEAGESAERTRRKPWWRPGD
jgi:uncharacterized coiled-coil protein SlyX